jgi:hypothetical protein
LSYSITKNSSVNSFKIHKNDLGIPEIFHINIKQKEYISLSHHGRYGGYAIL